MTTTFPTTIAEGDTVPEPFDWANSVGGVLNDLQAFAAAPTAPTASPGDSSSAAASTEFVTLANGLLIPKSLVTAKGDLIGATAAGTPTRIPVGADGQVLTADSTQASGLGWKAPSAGTSGFAAPTIGGKSGSWYRLPAATATGANDSWRLSRCYFRSVIIVPPGGGSGSYTAVAINITTAVASSTVRVGIYGSNSDGSCNLANKLMDVALASTATGVVSSTITLTLPAGLYWLATVQQGAVATFTRDSSVPPINGASAQFSGSAGFYYLSSVTGALPTTGTLLESNENDGIAALALKVA